MNYKEERSQRYLARAARAARFDWVFDALFFGSIGTFAVFLLSLI